LLSDIEDMRLRKKAIQDRTQKFFPEIQVKSEGIYDKKLQETSIKNNNLIFQLKIWQLDKIHGIYLVLIICQMKELEIISIKIHIFKLNG